jgi:hypothetical protein
MAQGNDNVFIIQENKWVSKQMAHQGTEHLL